MFKNYFELPPNDRIFWCCRSLQRQIIGTCAVFIIWINSCIPPRSSFPAIPSTSSIITTDRDLFNFLSLNAEIIEKSFAASRTTKIGRLYRVYFLYKKINTTLNLHYIFYTKFLLFFWKLNYQEKYLCLFPISHRHVFSVLG